MPDTGGRGADGGDQARSVIDPKNAKQGLMEWLRNLTLKSKLLLMLLPIGLLSMSVQSILGHVLGTSGSMQQGMDHAVAVRQSKKQQVEQFYGNLRDMIPLLAEDVAVVSATSLMKDAFGQLGRKKLAEDRRKSLEDFYRKSFIPDLATRTGPGEHVLFENVWPRSDRAIEAQVLYIAENRFKDAERFKLIDHPISNPYTLAHFTYHGRFLDMMQRLKLYDLMLVDADAGNVVYSVAKEVEFGTSLTDGPFSNTNLGRLVRRVLAEHKKGYVVLSDYEAYAPSGFVPAQFIAAPVYANFRLIGILVGQVSAEAMNLALNGLKSWKQDGLGESGAVFVVGRDRKLRSDHRRFIENRDELIAGLKQNGVPDETLNRMRRLGTTIVSLPVNIDAVDRAQRGETGTMIGRSFEGRAALQAYAPLNIADLNWSLVTQINQSEVLAPVNSLQRNMMILACAMALGTVMLSMLLANRFLGPINRLIAAMADLRSGTVGAKIAPTSTDEFGLITSHFNDMSDQLRERDAKIAEKTEGNSQLLKRLFPTSIVERMVKGETQVVDHVANVTVVYASVIGFAKSTEALMPVDSMKLLSDVFDVFDAQAAEHGIERVKTIGEHFIGACGLSEARLDHAQRSVAFCDAVNRELKRLAVERNLRLDMRAALASGDINAGLVGDRRFVFEIWGKPLNFARRLVHEAATGELRITDATNTLLGSSSSFVECAGIHGRTLGQIRNFGRRIGESAVTVAVDQAAE